MRTSSRQTRCVQPTSALILRGLKPCFFYPRARARKRKKIQAKVSGELAASLGLLPVLGAKCPAIRTAPAVAGLKLSFAKLSMAAGPILPLLPKVAFANRRTTK